jgi:hypothetical protein
MKNPKTIFFIVELGGYPVKSIATELGHLGYTVEIGHSMRKSMTQLKSLVPDIIVTEFNTTTQFRDRVSNLEPLLARMQSTLPKTRLIVFLDKEDKPQLERLRARFPIHAELYYPLDMESLLNCIQEQIEQT